VRQKHPVSSNASVSYPLRPLRDVLVKDPPFRFSLVLKEFWAQEIILSSQPKTIYWISRTEPFRLVNCIPPDCNNPPHSRALIGRTVQTVINCMEPEQPGLLFILADGLRQAQATKQPVLLQYRKAIYGKMKTATIIDEGPDRDYLTIICEEEN